MMDHEKRKNYKHFWQPGKELVTSSRAFCYFIMSIKRLSLKAIYKNLSKYLITKVS